MLKHKLALAGVASGVVVALFSLLFFIDRGGWGGQFLSVMASAIGFGLVLFAISAWCLGISHALGWVSAVIMNGETNSEHGKLIQK